ncbi:shikimate dehydrogenase [Fictibacillus phosphorivorans]|uniref:shikimate dehydrogenase n=1 Tax=Fictibacillus phosphorivorans TaxID=1221500 RepID=UPI00203E3041|nr:shikimate dehydrogenase [Fictibacillus phosphorivorans]MCM3716904.1 shikimate dehydrogenase [Fictibacillus phosphorivorans]MCM3774547.1 shikimate dehydrogenase [Fictibacillus phosphorivorans]
MIKALVIGDPIEHSLSPVMHNEAFIQAGIEGSYEKKRVTSSELPSFLHDFKQSDYAGCNVTIPHKVAVIPFLDEIDPEAKKIGAVNTIVNKKGKLIGYNTDGKGFLLGLKEKISRPISELNILLIGAGGAARSIAYAMLKENPKKLFIANRSPERLALLVKDLNHSCIEPLSLKEAENELFRFDVLVNTTNAGMYPNVDTEPLPLAQLKEDAVVSDIVYNPLQTKWLQSAENKGAIIDNGVSMLVMQGAMAFEKWTGIFPNTDKMKEAVIEQLRR